MDATPVTLGQEFGGYADADRRRHRPARRHDAAACARCRSGGTAVGTGINAPKGFARKVIARLAARTGLPLTEAKDHFAAQGARDALVETSGQLRVLAVSLIKIANDLRWMGERPAHRSRRDPAPRSPTRLVDHAGQGQSGDPRGRHPGRRAGDRQRRRGRVRRFAGQLRAERVRAGDRPQPARVDRPARERVRGVRRQVHPRHRGEHRDARALRGGVARRSRTALNPHLGYETTAEIIKESKRTGKSIRDDRARPQADDRRASSTARSTSRR